MDSSADQQADAEFRQVIWQQQGILSVEMEGCRNTLVGLSKDARLLDMQVSKLIARHCDKLFLSLTRSFFVVLSRGTQLEASKREVRQNGKRVLGFSRNLAVARPAA